MAVLSISNIFMEYDAVKIFAPVSFSLNDNDKLALIGRNGCGKSTLLKIISGAISPSSGEVHKAKDTRIAYLEQMTVRDEHISIMDFVLLTFEDLMAMESRLRDFENKMNHVDHDSSEFQKLMEDYHLLSSEFEKKGGYIYRSKALGILNGLGFSEADRTRKAASLSGGEMVRLKLAKLLVEEPDVLLLDEPTNHLDIPATIWLENFLDRYSKAVIIVSHDRYFLDRVINKTLELTKSRAYQFEGNYTEFKRKKEELLATEISAYEKNITERKRQEEIIRRFKSHGTEKLVKRAKSREKMLEKMDELDMPDIDNSMMKLTLTSKRSSAREVLKATHISKSFADNKVLDDLDFEVYRGEKIGIIGANGCGKSTFIRIITGSDDDFTGKLDFGINVDISYYDQKLKGLSDDKTIIEEIRDFRPLMTDTEIRTLLGSFLFTNDESFKPISTLSGGERARVTLTKLFLEQSNLLILDEPTNHLDIYAKEVLEKALIDFDGTVLMVSHDRYFLENIASRIVEIENGKATSYKGSYSYYLEKKEPVQKKVIEEKKTEKNDYHLAKEEERKNRKQKNKIKKLEARLEELEGLIEEIDTKLYDPEVYTNVSVFEELSADKMRLEEEYGEVFDELSLMD